MVAYYLYKIIRESVKDTPAFTINDVPAFWRAQVQAQLDDYCTSLTSQPPQEEE